jgi:hypothetical protein
MTGIRLGELLIEQGVLSSEQVDHIVRVQRDVGRPFGDLAERLFGVDPRAVENAWATQYNNLAGVDDPATLEVDTDCLRLVNRRQAWQFFIAPFARNDGELRILTDQAHLARAVNFAAATFSEPVFFQLTSPEALKAFLMARYPVPEFMVEFAASRR